MESREDIKGQKICSVSTSSLNELKQPTTIKNQTIPQKQPSSTININNEYQNCNNPIHCHPCNPFLSQTFE